MSNTYVQFSCSLPVGAGNVEAALALYGRVQEEREAEGDTPGFEAETRDGALWLYDGDGGGDVEGVIAFALRCAGAFGLTGSWGFCWGLSAGRPRLDACGGGAQVLDLGRRESIAWVDAETWLAERLAADEARPVPAEALLRPVAAAQGWVPATQAGVLLGFVDALIADDPGVADRLHAHLAEVSADTGNADPGEMNCRECGEPMFIAAEGTSHHVGDTMDGIDHGRDRDHTALLDRGA